MRKHNNMHFTWVYCGVALEIKRCFNILKIKPQNKSIISGLWVTYGIDVPFSRFD